MRLKFQIIKVGWEADFDNNRHPSIHIRRGNWSAVLYDHPAEGWQVVSLEIARRTKHDTHIEEFDGEAAESKFQELVGGEISFASADLSAIENDLYEIGRKGAAKRWVGKPIVLKVEKTEGKKTSE
ncbi:MAG: hypothetical protein HY327_06220 [Chloroflexi bacterium]|nr:hypothetical protein [Chloroflexota bacterium]